MTDRAIKYVGVDGCPSGWVAVGLGDGDESCVKVFRRGEFPMLLEHFSGASVVLVDMPIGLHEDGKTRSRACDEKARKKLGAKRQSSVFSTPSRQFLNMVMAKGWERADASKWSHEKWGRKVNAQEFGIFRKIHEINDVLPSDKIVSSNVREAHPEVCFWALNGGTTKSAMSHKKSKPLGFWQRFRVACRNLQKVSGIDVVDVFEKARLEEPRKTYVADDDILDALALAITAKLGWQNGFRRLPEDLSPDRKKPPEMVYYAIPNEK